MDLEIKLKDLDTRIKKFEKEKISMDAKKIYLEEEKKQLEKQCREKGLDPNQLIKELQRLKTVINTTTKKVEDMLDAVSFNDEV